jgi:DegV family protein with EDD domain
MGITKLSISADSTADLSEELYKEFEINTVPLGVILGDRTYRDGVDIIPDMIYDAVENQKIAPKTNAVLETDYREMFEKGVSECGAHIHFSLSDKLSLSYDNAVRASQGLENVYIINSLNLSAGTGILGIFAREMANEGKSVDEIVAKCKYHASRARVSFVVKSLTYLHRGGRCSGLKLLGANILKLHPQLIVTDDGHLVSGKVFRGDFPKVVKQYTDFVLETYPNKNKEIAFVTHTDIDPEIEKQVENDLRNAGFKRVYNTTAGCAITSHCGRSTIGILFCEE